MLEKKEKGKEFLETGAPPICIFCGYAHEDKSLFNHLNKHLAVLRSQQYITLWHYGEIPPGAEWESAITRHLDQADIILLLISPGFMDSEYCRGKEMRRAIERHKTGEVHLIPILLRPTPAWKATALGSLQALPAHANVGKTINSPLLTHKIARSLSLIRIFVLLLLTHIFARI